MIMRTRGGAKKAAAKIRGETFKEEDSIPSSTSKAVPATVATYTSDTTDEETITSSTKSCDDTPPSESPPLPTAKQKFFVDGPPDDVGAFFGHPLTRATSALNGEEMDTNAQAEALLHEYINLPTIDRDELKVNEKLHGFLDIISGQRSDPTLNTTHPEVISSSPTPTSSHSPEVDPHHNHRVITLEGEVVGDFSPQGDVIAMPEYVSIFLQENFQPDKNLMEGHADSHASLEVQSVNTATRALKRSKSTKEGLSSAQQKRGSASVARRAPRMSRSKSSIISSTTNRLMKKSTASMTGTKNPSEVLCYPTVEAKVFSGPEHRFPSDETGVTTELAQNGLSNVITSVGTVPFTIANVISTDVTTITANNDANTMMLVSCDKDMPQVTEVGVSQQHLQQMQRLLPSPSPQELIVAPTANNTSSVSCCSPSGQVVTDVPSSSSEVSTATVASRPIVTSAQAAVKDSSQKVSYESLIKENHYLKKALSDKIRSRQSAEEALTNLPTHNLQLHTDDLSGTALETKYTSLPLTAIKQEEPYIESYDHPYGYGADLANTSLIGCSGLPITTCANDGQNMLPITMATCEDTMTPSHSNNNGMAGPSLHLLQSSPVEHLGHNSSGHSMQDAVIVQSSQGQCFQILQPMESHSQVSSSNNAVTSSAGNTDLNYYSYVYQRNSNPHVLVAQKHEAVERYLYQQQQQQQQLAYGSGYTHFLNTDNYNMKSPDSGFHEPCLSPNSSSTGVSKEAARGNPDITKEKQKKKKSSSGGILMRQYSSSGSDKAAPKSPAIQKLEVNTTGYSYFLDSPISTTQRKDEDRVTYLNKSQYYGLTLDFNTAERTIKSSVVKSVIILAFREEKTMEEERKAWEFWHGRQHSYKQRILDIDTKNCQGVLPQNIEEVSFNAVVVKWNPMEGPVRVNIAVHCLSTDFSNQKGVKGIPLHIQIDTYEQNSKDSHLVHRGYCQIKAFCDKGAERKTRDEERRKTAKGKSDEFASAPVTTKSKGRKKSEEAFQEPCDKSEFYSMSDTTNAPVFFNPLHENSEFLHKSLTLGVLPSQEEEISSLPTSIELPDSCDDYYTNSPAKRARRDSSSNSLKEQSRILLYVRERQETAYTALMLEVPTLHGLLRSIEQKYTIAPSKVKNLYKKSKNGILVKLDDNIVRHYSHEATFIIEMTMINDEGDYEITLIEIDPVQS